MTCFDYGKRRRFKFVSVVALPSDLLIEIAFFHAFAYDASASKFSCLAHIVDVEFADVFALVISVAEEILLSVFDISSLLIVDKITLLVLDLISAKELIF